MKKTLQPLILLRSVAIIALLVAIPFGIFYLCAVNRPAAFSDSYYAGLKVKYDRLRDVKTPKVVVIGGSATAFAIDSDLLEKETGRPTVNFGLYAAIGFKPMLDLALPHIDKDDIVILLPELSAQTYSTYAGYEYLLYAMEKRPDMALALGFDYAKFFLHNYPAYIKNADKALLNPTENATIYAASSFSEKGDICYERSENIMSLGFSIDNPPEIDSKIITDSFASMVNDFTSSAEKKGARVYIGFPPMNSASLSGIAPSEYHEFTLTLAEKVKAEICGSIDNSIMEPAFFYDSNFHVNDAGSVYYSLLLSNDIKRIMGIVSENLTAVPTPPPLYITIAAPMDIDGFKCLATEESVFIIGVTDELKEAYTVTIPDTLAERKVVSLQGAIFDGCTNLTEIHLECLELPEVGNFLLSGTNGHIKIKVPKDLYMNYLTDYFWGYYSENLE